MSHRLVWSLIVLWSFPALAPAAATLEAAGCRYQWARTLVAMGGAERARGEAELAAMGATVMAWPPG